MRPRRQVIGQRISAKCRPVQPAKAACHRDQQAQRDQVSRRQAEQQQRDIGHPRSESAPQVANRRDSHRMGEAGIVAAVGEQHREQRDGADGADNPAGLGEQARQARIARFDDGLPCPHPRPFGHRAGHAFNSRA